MPSVRTVPDLVVLDIDMTDVVNDYVYRQTAVRSANGDGLVDVADLGILGANFNQSNIAFADGDFNDDGIVDVADLGILGANWTAGQATGNASALVPEPTTLSLLAMSVLMVCRYRHLRPTRRPNWRSTTDG